jgi:hypothetical protein
MFLTFIGISILTIFSIVTILLYRSEKIPLFSLSGLATISFFFFISFPGVFISQGILFGHLNEFSKGVNLELYVVNFIATFVFVASVFFGQLFARNYSITFSQRLIISSKMFRLITLISLIIVFSTMYLSFADGTSPLLQLLFSDKTVYEILKYRIDLRSGTEGFLAARIDWIFIPVATLLAFVYFDFLKHSKKAMMDFLIFFIAILFLLFLMFYRLGRDDFLIILFLLFNYSLLGTNKIHVAKFFYAFSIVVLAWFTFSITSDKDFLDVLMDIAIRVYNQTAFTYVQIDMIDGPIYFTGIKNPFSTDYISPSKLAFTHVMGRSGGSTAGYGILNFYFIFGVFGFLISSIVIFLVSVVDRVFLNSILSGKKLSVSIYASFIALYLPSLLFNFFGIINFFILFNTTGWVFIASLLFLFRLQIFKLKKI